MNNDIVDPEPNLDETGVEDNYRSNPTENEERPEVDLIPIIEEEEIDDLSENEVDEMKEDDSIVHSSNFSFNMNLADSPEESVDDNDDLESNEDSDDKKEGDGTPEINRDSRLRQKS